MLAWTRPTQGFILEQVNGSLEVPNDAKSRAVYGEEGRS